MKRYIAIVLVLCLIFSVSTVCVSAYTLPDGFDVSKEPNSGKDTVDGQVFGYLGDVDLSDNINIRDATNIQKYVASLTELGETETTLADVDFSGKVNIKDATAIQKWIASMVVDLPIGHVLYIPDNSGENHKHNIKEVKKVTATCTEEGNIAYWKCSTCDMCFGDVDGSIVIYKESTMTEALGHNEVVDPAVLATHSSTGLTEGSHCSRCGTVIKKQEVVPVLKSNEFSIKYYITNNDNYLQQVGVNNPNPDYYDSEVGLRLSNISVDGYIFEGWYDGQGASAEQIKRIPIGETGDLELFAHWSKINYNVQFDVGLTNVDPNLVSVGSKTYTVDQGLVLPMPKLDGYIFAGWSDKDGVVYKRIDIGTIGHKTYTGNWISERNLAYTKNKLDEPLVYEDDKVILFTYEIGEIRNVPLYTLCDFGKINTTGIKITKEFEHTTTTSKTMMEGYTDVVSKATTESFGWTLSNEWSHSTSINEEWAKANGLTVAKAEEICTDESNNWYVSSGQSGSDTTEKVDTKDTYDLNTTTENTKTYNVTDTEIRQDFSAELNVNGKFSKVIANKASLGGNVGASGDVGNGIEGSAGINGGLESGTTKGREVGVGLDLKYSNGKTTNTKTGTEVDSGSSDQTGSITHTGEVTTNVSSWNSEVGASGSFSVSQSNSVSQAVSEQISEKYGYGESYINSENKTQDQNFESTSESSKEYSSSVTYGTSESTKVKETYSTTNTISGYHRIVMAGTAHVFAVVGYNIESNSYFVNSFTVMDDEQHQYQDYSYDYSSYDDNQNGVIKFEAPADITEYVAERINASDGLEVNKSGIITAYTGTDRFVVIPEYKVIKNSDGTSTVVKVTGISKNAFAGNTNIQLVEMSDFVTHIPTGAFKGCSSLLSFEGSGISSIGEDAFVGCSSLKACTLGENVVSLGENAFEGMEYFTVVAVNKSIVEAAVKSGAKNITIGISDKCTDLVNTTLTIPDGTKEFVFNGFENEFNNVYIISDAEKTIINRAAFNSDSKTPLLISSSEIELQEVTVDASGIALITSAEEAKISLYGESYLISKNGRSMLCKHIDLEKKGTDYYSQLNVDGNILVCGEFDDSYLTFVSGTIEPVDEATFEKYHKGVARITFNVNGGSSSVSYKEVYYGDKVGQLPEPVRENCDFDGWYTESGVLVTSDTVCDFSDNLTVKAHWSSSGWVLASKLPADAQRIDTKWSYNLTTNITSDKSYVAGYTLYNTTSAWGSYGSWSSWSKSAVSSSDSRQVETKTVTDRAGYTNYKYWIYRTSDGWGYGTKNYVVGTHGACTVYDEINLTYSLPVYDSSLQTYGPYNGSKFSHAGDSYWFYGGSSWVPAVTHTEYRYRDRSLIYTYYHTKTENLESSSIPSGTGVSNVNEWVKYIVK